MGIYTKVGDKGLTQYKGQKVPKNKEVFEFLGTLDEAQAQIGLLYHYSLLQELKDIMKDIYTINSIIYTDGNDKEALQHRTKVLEQKIDEYMFLKDLKDFVLPIGSMSIAQANIARAVVRRAERIGVNFGLFPYIQQYINRLSDYLFALSIHLGGGKYEMGKSN